MRLLSSSHQGLPPRLTVGFFAALTLALVSCSSAPQPFLVSGPGVTGNDPPTLTFLQPTGNITRGQGDRFVVRWTDTDRDSNAQISFAMVGTASNARTILVEGIDENDLTGPDSFSAPTSLLSPGTYYLLGIIDDDVNSPIEVFAQRADSTNERVVITITPQGAAPPTVPPIVTVTEPAFNLSVAQDDVLNVAVQPTEGTVNPDNPKPYDPDSPVTLYILLDVDQDPNNDDPANPQTDPSTGEPVDIIVLRQQTIEEERAEPIEFEIDVDLDQVPPRANGEPYYIRATVDDLNNPRVHQYAEGTMNVVELAAGEVDLADIGKTKSGARFYGFTPGANLGSSASSLSDFDGDGVADFVLVAQFGNSRNYGLIGEAYLVYGVDQIRYGGAIAANSISEAVSGAIFEAPPVRNTVIGGDAGFTNGITDVSWVPDMNGDGDPEILFGLDHVHGAIDTMDYDPGDEDAPEAEDQIEVVIRQGAVTYTVNNVPQSQDDNFTYRGVEDTVIGTLFPNSTRGSDDLTWVDSSTQGSAEQEWTLIKFIDLLDQLPDPISRINVSSVRATLELRLYNTGGGGRVFQALTDFSEATTYSDFAVNSGDPEAGVDYDADPQQPTPLAAVDGTTASIVSADISELVRRLLDRELVQFNNEIRMIIIPQDSEEAVDQAGVRSSEWSIRTDERPTLRIQYSRRLQFDTLNCYPDFLVNNRTNPDPALDWQWYAGGMAVMVMSTNRDNDNIYGVYNVENDTNPLGIDPRRLEETVISIELVGQESASLDRDGTAALEPEIVVRADNVLADNLGNDPPESSHISGARFVGGWYDWIDGQLLNQPPRTGLFGRDVASIGDLNNDGLDEFIFSAPLNERYISDLELAYGFASTHLQSTALDGSILIVPGANYNGVIGRDKSVTGDDPDSSSIIPVLDQWRFIGGSGPGSCLRGVRRIGPVIPQDTFQIFAEDIDDFLGDGQSAGDFNQDGLDDILCGAPLNDRSSDLPATGATYILYGSNVGSDYDLKNASNPVLRTPMLRIRGVKPGDRIGWRQATGRDVNGDRIADVFFSSPTTDFGGVIRQECGADFTGDGLIDSRDFELSDFLTCQSRTGSYVFSDDDCIAFDYDYDHDIDDSDRFVFDCLQDGRSNCCANLVENGFVGVIFGGVFLDGDRTINQLATSDLPGAIFYGAAAGHRAGYDISSAGDFNQDGFGDILITAPGETRTDINGRERLGVVYMIFGGTHLINSVWSLDDVGSDDLPGVVFLSPYRKGRPNEAAPETVTLLGDINNDGFGDICIGNPKADFIDLTFPQGPDAPGDDPSVGRRRDAGDAYVIYGNNFGSNRGLP